MFDARFVCLQATMVGGVAVLSAAELPLNTARSVIEEWVQVRKTLAITQADWIADKMVLEQTLAMLDRELAGLREQLARVETNQAAVAEQRQTLLAQQAQYQAGLDAVRTRVEELEAGVRRIEPFLPPLLKSTVQPLLNRLPTNPTATNVALVPRVLALITLLNEVDKFQSTFTVTEETRPGPDGRELAVQVLYAGLAQAWFVNKKGDFAGVGVPTSSGWRWTTRPELAPAITRAIQIYRKEHPPQFVPLPVQLQ